MKTDNAKTLILCIIENIKLSIFAIKKKIIFIAKLDGFEPLGKTDRAVEDSSISVYSIEIMCHLTFVSLFSLFVVILNAVFCKSVITFYITPLISDLSHIYIYILNFYVF